MRKKELEMLLEGLEEVENPDPKLEQYMLTGRDSARFLWRALPDITNSRVLDPGCGTGRLSIGAALLGAWHVVGLDIDVRVLSIAKRNIKRVGVGGIVDLICCEYAKPCIRAVDVVVQNPPFGVQKPHSDRIFVASSMGLARIVYSIHKAGNRDFLIRLYGRYGGIVDWVEADVVELKATMLHHVKRIYRVRVDIYRVVRGGS